MSSERAPLPTGGKGPSQGTRARSYGSLVRSPVCSVRQRHIEHKVQPGETLQGLALKYGVSMEQIKRANRLYTNDSIFLKKSVSIPVLADFDGFNNGNSDNEAAATSCTYNQQDGKGKHSEPVNKTEKEQVTASESPELSPMDFLRRMDLFISQSKMAAVKKISEGDKRFTCAEEAHCQNTSSSQAVGHGTPACSVSNHRTVLGAVPLTITKHAKALRDQEDEIFEL